MKVNSDHDLLKNFVELAPKYYIPSFKTIGLVVLGKKIFKVDHIWVWRQTWSCNLDKIYKVSFLFCLEAAYKM